LSLRSVYILVYLGVLGLILFLLLRPSIDFNALSPIEIDRDTIEQTGFEQLIQLGMDTSGVSAMTRRYQRVPLYDQKTHLRSRSEVISSIEIRSSGVPLSGWSILFGHTFKELSSITSDEILFGQIGKAILTFDSQGRVRTFRGNPDANDSFISGIDLIDASNKVLLQFGYDPDRFSLSDTIPLIDMQRDFNNPEMSTQVIDLNKDRTLTWESGLNRGTGPVKISLSYSPVSRKSESELRLLDSLSDPATELGIRVDRFYASYHELDTPDPFTSEIETSEIVFSFVSMAILVLVIVGVGLSKMFRGEIVWFRAVVIFGVVSVGLISYRILVLQNLYYRILSESMVLLDLLLYSFMAFFGAALIALAYVGWEAIARKQNQEQVPHIDALWRGNMFQQKIGKAVLAGYGYAGLSLAMWAVGMYFFRLVYFQYDGQLGFIDASSTFPSFTALLNSWLYTWFITFSAVALVMSLLASFISRSVIQVGLGAIVSALFVSNAYYFIEINGEWYEQWIVFVLLMVPIMLAFKYYGLLTAAVSMWILFVLVRVFVYLGSGDYWVGIHGYVLVGAVMIPFVAGLVLHHFGRNSLLDVHFIPEYEQRLQKQRRLEREFQIAKESQYALLPKSAPVMGGVDVKGFFIPSFDVGGDFYEHVVRSGDHGHGDELFVTVVDVSGKGMKAALTAIFTSGLLLSRVRSHDCDPAQIVSDVNTLLFERVERQMFVTCILAKYTVGDRLLEYVNAGHCQPVLVRRGKAQLLSSALPRFPMGIRQEVRYQDMHVQLELGDTVFFYSDGLPEAKSPTGELFDYSNVPELCEQAVAEHKTAHEMCESIKKHMLNFSNYELADDLTVVVLRI